MNPESSQDNVREKFQSRPTSLGVALLARLGLSRPPKFIAFLGFGALALIVFVFILSLLGSTFRSLAPMNPLSSFMPTSGNFAFTLPSSMGMDVTSEGAAGYAGGSYSAGEHYSKDGDIGYTTRGMPTLSLQNVTSSIMPIPPVVTGAVGDNAEDFEVTDYSAQIETGKLESTCASIKELKGRSYVIFENANESDSYCSYTFKVKHENVEEVLAFIKDLDPKDLSESTYTIKRQIDDYTSEEEVLTSKKKSIEDTLKSALSAYDEITSLATRTQDTETLAKIIDSRIGIIERLTQQSIAVNEQLDRLARSKADSLDRLEYAFFNVSIYENTFIDGENLADSWKAAIKQFVVDVNAALLAATVGLIGFLLTLVPFALYFLVLLILAKVGWKVVRRVWQK